MTVDAEQMVPLGWVRRSLEKRGVLAQWSCSWSLSVT